MQKTEKQVRAPNPGLSRWRPALQELQAQHSSSNTDEKTTPRTPIPYTAPTKYTTRARRRKTKPTKTAILVFVFYPVTTTTMAARERTASHQAHRGDQKIEKIEEREKKEKKTPTHIHTHTHTNTRTKNEVRYYTRVASVSMLSIVNRAVLRAPPPPGYSTINTSTLFTKPSFSLPKKKFRWIFFL